MGLHTLSETIGNSGGPVVWTSQSGDKYSFSLLDLSGMSKFENAILQKDMEMVKSLKGAVEPKEYEQLQAKVLDKWVDGEYAFGAKRCMKELETLWGIANIVSIISGLTPNKCNELIQNNDDLKDFIRIVIEKSFPLAGAKKKETLTPTGPS